MKPSEEAMQDTAANVASLFNAIKDPKYADCRVMVNMDAVVAEIGKHTTEALAEHVRVLDMAEKLASMASQVAAMELGTGSAPDFQPADFGLAADNLLTAIAELNALPCPPIEATKDK